jgi:hypothetical protein
VSVLLHSARLLFFLELTSYLTTHYKVDNVLFGSGLRINSLVLPNIQMCSLFVDLLGPLTSAESRVVGVQLVLWLLGIAPSRVGNVRLEGLSAGGVP